MLSFMAKKSVDTAEILSNFDQNIIQGVRACIEMNESILFIGETGTGKTTLASALGEEKGKKLHRVSVNGSMGIDEILGKWLAKDGSTYWIDGILTRAVREGDWVIFDELNAMLPEMGFALHSLLDDAKSITLAEKDGEVVKAHSDFRFFGSMNPTETYAGTKDVNMALMSRFGGVFQIDVFPTHQELKILQRHKVDVPVATKLVNLGGKLRDMRKNGDLYTWVSTRDLIQAGKIATHGLDISLAIQYAILNKMTEDEKADIAKSKVIDEYTKGAKIFLDPEMQKLKNEAEAAKKAEGIKEAYARLESEVKTLKDENEKLSKSKGLSGIDPKTALLLKKLGLNVTAE